MRGFLGDTEEGIEGDEGDASGRRGSAGEVEGEDKNDAREVT